MHTLGTLTLHTLGTLSLHTLGTLAITAPYDICYVYVMRGVDIALRFSSF